MIKNALTAVFLQLAYTPFAFAAHQFTPATGAHPSIIVSVVATTSASYRFTYQITNEASASQDVREIYLAVQSTPTSIQAPTEGWAGVYKPGEKVVAWVVGSLRDIKLLNPGHQLNGFTLISSELPDLTTAYVRGNAPLPVFDEGDDSDPGFPDVYEDAVKVRTIGPGQFALSDFPSAIDRLAGLKHQVADLGWLGDARFVLKLDKRLDEAKSALTSDKKKLARVRLTQFVHDLSEVHEDHGESGHERGKDKDEHRREKFVNDEAFQLLKINVDFIIAKLPTKAGDRDEENECRRAESDNGDSGRGDGGDRK